MAFLAPPGVPGCLRDLEKNCKNSQKIYKKLTCIKIPQIIALRPILGYLDYPGGPQGGQKVIWWCKKFFLAESIWSFRQNTLYLSQVSGLGGHEPWFWLCPFTTPPYLTHVWPLLASGFGLAPKPSVQHDSSYLTNKPVNPDRSQYGSAWRQW